MPGKLVQAAANASRSEARKTGVSSIEQFIQSRKVIAKDVATFAPATFVAPSLQLHGIDVKQLPTARVGTKLIGSQRVVPLHKGCNRINVAASDPTNEESFLPLKIATDPTVEEMVVEEDKLAVPPKRFGQTGTKAFDSMIGDETVLENIDLDDDTCLEDGNVDGCGQLEEIGDTPAVKYVRKVLLDKINGGASDIHFEPCEKGYQIRYRADGILRILDPSSATMGFESLGYEPEQCGLLHAIRRPHGMALVTWPTGSGKTVSLYTCLNILNVSGMNISTAENPAVINLSSINQINVNDMAGLPAGWLVHMQE
jgi:type IV pilus assembly protein PilB